MKNETIRLYNIKYYPKQKYPRKNIYIIVSNIKIYIEL